jgi:hypothetical protein
MRSIGLMGEMVVELPSPVRERVFPMQLNIEVRQLVQQTAGSAEPLLPWILGSVDDGPRVEPALRPYSYTSECECPDDCLRDHENE